MARRSAKKKTDSKKTTSPDEAVAVVPDATPLASAPDGAALLADLEERCVSLRSWHQQASATLETRETEFEEQARQLAKQQKTLDKTNAQLNNELKQLTAERTQVEAERSDLAEMRTDLDAEWTALRNLRDAQAKLGQELDAERQRLNRRAFKLTTPPAATHKLKVA